MPAGVWCLDPKIGLYHRYAIGSGESTDYGQLGIKDVGALYALNIADSKFFASYEYYLTSSTTRSVLAYEDSTNSLATRGFIVTPFFEALKKVWKTVDMFHKKLASGEKMRLYYRFENDDSTILDGTWFSATQFNYLGTGTTVAKGDLVMVKVGNGAGQLVRVDSVTESTTVTSITMAEALSFISDGDTGAIEIIPFKYMGEITNTTKDYDTFTIPESNQKRKFQLLVEYRQSASNRMETDYIIVNT